MLDREIEVKNKTIKISQDLSLSHAGTVWDGALTQIAFWNKNPQIASQYLQNQTVLELGSGTGILGLAASLFNPKKIYLTDLDEFLKLLSLNVDKNKEVLPNNQDICVCPLQWGNTMHMQKILEQKVNTIIGSQLAYDRVHIVKLMETLSFFKKANPNLKVLISYQNYKEKERNLLEQVKKYFGQNSYTLIQKQLMDEDYQDNFLKIISF